MIRKIKNATLIFMYCCLCFTPLCVSAQTKFQLHELNITNDGEGRTMATIRKTKENVDGEIVIIDGVSTQYIKANFEKGKAVGKWQVMVNNKLVKESVFADGYEQTETEYFDSGKIASSKSYSKGKPDGNWKSYLTDGQLEWERSFKDGLKTGTWKTYHKNGKIAQGITYENDVQNGKEWRYNEEDVLTFDCNFVEGKPVGKSYQVWSGNAGNSIETVKYNKHGEMDGEFLRKFDNDEIHTKGNYQHGKKHGEWIYGRVDGTKTKGEIYDNDILVTRLTYYTNGQIDKSESINKDGRLDGVVKRFNQDGTLKSEVNYKMGREEGQSIMTYISNNGNYTVTSNYVKGKLDGNYKEVYEGGKTKVIGQYENGTKKGVWTMFSKDGTTKTEQTY